MNKIAKLNTICHVRAFGGYPLTRCTLKGRYYDTLFNRWEYVINPLESSYGYYTKEYDCGGLDTCHAIIPTICKRWLQSGLKFSPKPFDIDWDNLPEYIIHNDQFVLKN